MKQINKIFIVLIVTVISLNLVAGPIKAQEGIKLHKIKGKVFYKTQGWWFFTGEWHRLTDSVELEVGDKIKTKQDSKAELIIDNTTRALIKSQSKLKINSKANGETDLTKLKLNLGEVIVKFINRFNDKFEVETPSTVAGVRGTTFKVVVSQEETKVAVAEGRVEVKTEQGKVEIGRGKMAKVTNKYTKPQVGPIKIKNKKDWKKDKEWIKETKEWAKEIKKKIKKQKKENQKEKNKLKKQDKRKDKEHKKQKDKKEKKDNKSQKRDRSNNSDKSNSSGNSNKNRGNNRK
ncbi:hypothetical protein JCM16358_02430 [Halanaerocella petrolearia]